jgi:regulator of sigma E protease
MFTVLISIVSFVIELGIMVLVHEFGHFLAAKLCGVRVEQFSIGFPPRLFGVKIGETDYCISATPLGGYVKMTGESMPGENLSMNTTGGETAQAGGVTVPDPGALTSHPRWQRIIIGLAGPCCNFLLALGLMTGLLMFHHEMFLWPDQAATLDWVMPGSAAATAGFASGDKIVSYDGKQNPSWKDVEIQSQLNLNHTIPVVVERNGQQISLSLPLADTSKGEDFSVGKVGLYPIEQPGPVSIERVEDKTPAAAAGLQAGDQFLTVDGKVFHGTETLIAYMQFQKGAPMQVELGRGGKTSQVVLQPLLLEGSAGKAWRIGFAGNQPPYRVEKLPLPAALAESAKFCRANSLLIVEVLKRLVTAKMSVNTLSGPLGIARQTGMAAQMPGWQPTIQLMTVISLNLGILNLMPFPILDGGMILFLIIESIMRRDVNPVVKERVYQVAFVLIIVFAAYVIFNDFTKLPFFTHVKT